MMRKSNFFFGVLLVVGAVGYLIHTGIRETSAYYFTIEEFLLKREVLANAGVRVAGRVQAGSVRWEPQELRLRFVLGPVQPGAAADRPVGVACPLPGGPARHVC